MIKKYTNLKAITLFNPCLNNMWRVSGILILVSLVWSSFAQEVSVSQEFNLRNDYSYELIGLVKKNIILFRDRGLDYQLDILDEELNYKFKRDISFEKKKVNVLDIVTRDTSFSIFYAYKEKGFINIRLRCFNHRGEVIDSKRIYKGVSSQIRGNFGISHSEDKSKTLIYAASKNDFLKTIAIDLDSSQVLYNDEISFKEFNLATDFKKAIITNKAQAFVLIEKNNHNHKKEKHSASIFHIAPESDDVVERKVTFNKMLSTDIVLKYNEFRDQILLTGLYHDKNTVSSKGYYSLIISLDDFGNEKELTMTPYKDILLRDVYGRDKDKEGELQHFNIMDVIFRRDGGYILVAEMHKELSRRSYYNGYNRYDNTYQSSGAWKDYYDEDVIMIAVRADGSEHWKKVLHKKQFSQDDHGIYSSYFLFKNPSRMHVIYNDEIKKNNTVSEYIIDPLGEYQRNSVMNTEYQNLRLRFRDGVQISENELLVPSERSYSLNLVKIKY